MKNDDQTSPEKKVLHLTLHRKWFDEICSGRKMEEYREASHYWIRRILYRYFDEIRFVNGYGKDRPFIRVEWRGASQRGAHIVIRLGKILEVGNVEQR